MYRVFLERGAEKDLHRLSAEIHDRVITAFADWPATRARPVAANFPAASTTGASAWAITGWFMRLPMKSA